MPPSLPQHKIPSASHLQKRSLSLSGHQTSIALEPEFWKILEKMAQQKNISLAKFISQIDSYERNHRPLASTLRLKALEEAFVSPPSMTIFDKASNHIVRNSET